MTVQKITHKQKAGCKILYLILITMLLPTKHRKMPFSFWSLR